MFRRALSTTTNSFGAAALVASTSVTSVTSGQNRSYRLFAHLDEEIEELHEPQSTRRWMTPSPNAQSIPHMNEHTCTKLNAREARRTGRMPEKSIARTLSQIYTEDGTICMPGADYTQKSITITIIGLDGHPFYIRTKPTEPLSLNQLINFSGMCIGWLNFFSLCQNKNCLEWQHGEGCVVNIDVDTLAKLPPPSRMEYYALAQFRHYARGDVKFNTRFSCQIPITPDLDGGVFAMKQIFSRSLKETAMGDWGPNDNYATVSQHKCRKIEPWAPMLEEPTKQDFPFTYEMIWADNYEDIMKHKYPKYRRQDGTTTRPRLWNHATV